MTSREHVSRVAAVIGEIARALESTDDVDRRIQRVLMVTRAVVPCQWSGVIYVDAHGQARTVVAGQEADAGDLQVRLHQLWTFLLGGGVLRDAPIAPAARIALPLMRDDSIRGLLMVEREGRRRYGQNHVRLMSAFASQLSAYLNLAAAPPDSRISLAEPEPSVGRQAIPLRCPCCDQHSGVPFRARTKAGVSSLVSLGSRCRACGYEWEQDVRTGPGQPGDAVIAR